MNYLFKYTFFFALFTLLFTSCGTEEEIAEDSLSLTLSTTQVTVGQSVSFTATSYNNGNVTADAQFFVNGNSIEGNTFTPTEENPANEVYSTWNGLTSPTLTFASTEEQVEPTTYTQKVLIEDYTGTWCGYCPGMANVFDVMATYSDNVIPVAIHCDNDPYQYEFQTELQTAYETTGLPKARINRIHNLAYYLDENNVPDNCGTNHSYYENLIQEYLDQSAPLGLAINSSLSGNDISFTVSVGMAQDVANAKLVVYLLEDGLLYEQTNYFSGSSNTSCPFTSQAVHIENFEHNHVLRKSYTGIFGDPIPASELTEGNIYTRDFNFPLPSEIENNANLSLVAFVMDNNDNVINAQYVHVGENQDFD